MVIDERILKLAAQGGWIGVDLDGTLFTYDTWVGWNVFGAPIAPMVERVRAWDAAGVPVRIVTARVGLPSDIKLGMLCYSTIKDKTCRVTNTAFSDWDMTVAIKQHCAQHIGLMMPVQCFKDVDMIELWDDRAVQVVANTGRTLAEDLEHSAREAEEAALTGKAWNGNIPPEGARE